MIEKDILGVVIIYNPNVEELIYNINQYIGNISKLIIWENSTLDNNEKKEIISGVLNSEKIVFEGNGENIGISKALNAILNKSYVSNYKFLLTMDQDSEWLNFREYLGVIERNLNKFKIFGPHIVNLYANENNELIKEDKIEKCDFVITSGAIYNMDLFSKIGGFDDEYFIDAVDEEICYRARKYGYSTGCIMQANLGQHFGEYKTKKIFGKTIAYSNYSPFRDYYIVRNHIWLVKSGLLKNEEKKLMLWNYVIAFTFKVLLFEKDKSVKINAIFKGFKDGILRK